MVLTPWDLVAHLDQAGLVATPESLRWPTLDTKTQNACAIDWNSLFREDQGWAIDDQHLIRSVDRNLGIGPPEPDESDEVASRRADVCAWYQPIHFHGLGWGIFILEDCLKMIAADIARWLPRHSAPSRWPLVRDLLRAAFGTLFLHEAYHHRTECFSIRAWTVDGVSRYRPYWGSVYAPTVRSPGALEEALANASSFQRLAESAHRPFDRDVALAAKDYLKWRFPFEPPGYRDATKFLRRDAIWDAAQNRLKEQVATSRVTIPPGAADRWSYAPNMNEAFFGIKSNIWSVVPKGTAPVLPTFPLYRPASSKDIVRALERDCGYARVKGAGKGSHVRLRAAGLPPLTVPGGRKDLSPVVLRSVAKALDFGDVGSLLDALGC